MNAYDKEFPIVWRKIGFHVLIFTLIARLIIVYFAIFTLLTTSCMNDLAANLQKPFEADDTGVLLDPGILLPVGYQVQDLTLSAQMTNQSKIKKWESCEALSHSVANNTLLDFYGYYKSNSRCEPALLMSMEDSDDGATATALPSYTEQNSQVENVIEADVVFANANQLFQLDRDAIHVYNTWPATDFKEVGVLEKRSGCRS